MGQPHTVDDIQHGEPPTRRSDPRVFLVGLYLPLRGIFGLVLQLQE
jgi:hypothetical protein